MINDFVTICSLSVVCCWSSFAFLNWLALISIFTERVSSHFPKLWNGLWLDSKLGKHLKLVFLLEASVSWNLLVFCSLFLDTTKNSQGTWDYMDLFLRDRDSVSSLCHMITHGCVSTIVHMGVACRHHQGTDTADSIFQSEGVETRRE